MTQGSTSGPNLGPAVVRDSAQSLLSAGKQALESGLTPVAVQRFQELTARYPESAAAIEAQYWLGRSYEDLGVLRDAVASYDTYLAAVPEGGLSDEARDRAQRLRDNFDEAFPSPETLDERIASLRQRVAGNPDDFAARADLANALWTRGHYDEAASIYMALYDAEPDVANRAEFQRRIELHPDGTYTILTPSELARREREANPLQVVNFTGFPGIRDTFTQVPRGFIVTGQVVNRGDSVLYGVEITVTVYGFGNTVYDTGTEFLGNMRPGETRAFSMRFRNFRELNSIERYEYKVRFER